VCDHKIRSLHLPVVIRPGFVVQPPCALRCLGEGPGRILIAAFLIPFAFCLLVADPFAGDLPSIGDEVAYFIEPTDGAGLQHDGECQNFSDAGNVKEGIVWLAQLHLSLYDMLNGFDLTGQKINDFFTDLSGQCNIFVSRKKRCNPVRLHCLHVADFELDAVVPADDVLQTDDE